MLGQLVEKDAKFSTVLKQIKVEFDRLGGAMLNSSAESAQFVDLQVDNQQLQHSLTKSRNENTMLARESELLKRESSELKHLLKLKTEEIEAMARAQEQMSDIHLPKRQAQALGSRISHLESKVRPQSGLGRSLQRTGSVDSGAAWAELERVTAAKDKVDEQLITLMAQLKISQRRESDALGSLHDLRQQLNNARRALPEDELYAGANTPSSAPSTDFS